jgi:hypothetical protein
LNYTAVIVYGNNSCVIVLKRRYTAKGYFAHRTLRALIYPKALRVDVPKTPTAVRYIVVVVEIDLDHLPREVSITALAPGVTEAHTVSVVCGAVLEKAADVVSILPPYPVMVVVEAGENPTDPVISQSPGVREILVILAGVPVARLTAEATGIFEKMISPTSPEAAKLALVTPVITG